MARLTHLVTANMFWLLTVFLSTSPISVSRITQRPNCRIIKVIDVICSLISAGGHALNIKRCLKHKCVYGGGNAVSPLCPLSSVVVKMLHHLASATMHEKRYVNRDFVKYFTGIIVFCWCSDAVWRIRVLNRGLAVNTQARRCVLVTEQGP